MSTTCDFEVPTTTTNYTDVLQKIEDRATVLATMDFASTSNIPDEAIQYSRGNNRLEEYDSGGASWSTADLSGHLSGYLQTANNLSEVTAATARTNLGLGSLSTASSVNNSNWSGTDSAVANGGTGSSTASGARTALGLGDLATQDTINNGDWSGTVLAITNGGTGSATASAARTALGLGDMAEEDTINDSNWSGTDLAVGNGGTGSSTASGARGNLSAAKSGSNSDITAMTNCTSYTESSSMTFGTTAANTVYFHTDGTNRWEILDSGILRPGATNTYQIGSATRVVQTIYSVGIQGMAGADFTVLAQSGQAINFTCDGSFTAAKLRSDHYWQMYNLGGSSTKNPASDAVTEWWEFKNSAGNSRYIPCYTA